MILNRHGGSKYASPGSVDHRVSPPKEEEEKPPPSGSTHHLDQHEVDRATAGLREDLEHERDRRYALTDTVRRNRKDREADRAKDRADYAFAQLEVERNIRSLVDELATARSEIAYLRNQTERLERERKNLMEILERGGYLYRKKKARTDSMGGDTPRKP